MDCDFSHDPADVPRLIAACEDGADLALGSRYVPGGGTENWGLVRRLISRGGSIYARAPPGADPRPHRRLQVLPPRACSRRSTSTRSTPKGYAFQIETTYRTLRKGFRVVEVPIRFVDRTAGQSKMSRAIVLEAVWKVPALRLAPRWRGGSDRGARRSDVRRRDRGRAGRRRLLGAVVPAVPCDRADPRRAPERVAGRAAQHRRAPRDRGALRGALDPDGDALRRRRAARTVVGVRPRAHFEQLASGSAPSRRARRARRQRQLDAFALLDSDRSPGSRAGRASPQAARSPRRSRRRRLVAPSASGTRSSSIARRTARAVARCVRRRRARPSEMSSIAVATRASRWPSSTRIGGTRGAGRRGTQRPRPPSGPVTTTRSPGRAPARPGHALRAAERGDASITTRRRASCRRRAPARRPRSCPRRARTRRRARSPPGARA